MSAILLDAHAPWSLSKSDLAAKCTLAFRLRYIDKIRSGSSGTEAKVGVAAHRVQELLLQGVAPRDAIEQTLQEIQDLTSKEVETLRGLLEALIAYAKRIEDYKLRTGVVQELYEQEWAIDRNYQACAYDDPKALFRGIVDHGLLLADDAFVVVDHKSGKQREIDYYQKQLDAYAVLALAHLPQIRGVRAGIHFMKTKQLEWHTTRSRDVIENMLRPWLLHLLTSRAALLETHTANPTPLCGWCDYKDSCVAGSEFLAQREVNKKAKAKASRTARKELKVLQDAEAPEDDE